MQKWNKPKDLDVTCLNLIWGSHSGGHEEFHWKWTDVSEEHVAYIFMSKYKLIKKPLWKHVGSRISYAAWSLFLKIEAVISSETSADF
jgi:hypothetical protein